MAGKCMTTERFIEKARLKHGNTYGYDHVEYKRNRIHVIITCRIHGDFPQKPVGHLEGRGCKKCSDGVLTFEQFVDKAKETHDDKYLYDKSTFSLLTESISIFCKTHEHWFEQQASSHLGGQRCMQCYQDSRTHSVKEFIEIANNIHGSQYDYSKIIDEYKSTKSRVTVGHQDHEFTIAASDHIYDTQAGCPFCSGSRICTKTFIERANKIHENWFSYEKTEFINSDTKVIIICHLHGDFPQLPQSHLQGTGCPHCSFDARRLTNEEFIERAEAKHGDRYDYSLVQYVGNRDPVIIICRKHGEFPQKPIHHLTDGNCHGCAKVGISIPEKEWLDSLNIAQHYRHHFTKLNGKRYSFDAFDPNTNTIYEFYGDYWHGNPDVFDADVVNKRCNATFGELYKRTIEREYLLKSYGYSIVSIWENEFRGGKNTGKYKKLKCE